MVSVGLEAGLGDPVVHGGCVGEEVAASARWRRAAGEDSRDMRAGRAGGRAGSRRGGGGGGRRWTREPGDHGGLVNAGYRGREENERKKASKIW